MLAGVPGTPGLPGKPGSSGEKVMLICLTVLLWSSLPG